MTYWEELTETIEKLELLLERDESYIDEHAEHDWLERKGSWYMLWLSIKRFKSENIT